MNTNICIEVVQYRPNAGVSDEAMLAAAQKIQSIVENFDGLNGWQVLKDEDGQWMDIAYWRSREDAERAAQQAMENPGFLEAMSVIDQSTIVMKHFDQMLEFATVE